MFTKTKQSRNFHVNITKITSTEHIPKALDELKLVISSKFITEVFKKEKHDLFVSNNNENQFINILQQFEIKCRFWNYPKEIRLLKISLVCF